MAFLKPYKRLNKLIENETFEPMISWGIRMAISAMAPLIWGLATNNVGKAIWITLTAECLCWVELKGSFGWQVRTLFAGAILAVVFSILGSITGHILWLSVLLMLVVAFIASILRNIGDRASGLAICVYLLFIFCNAYPVTVPGQHALTYEAVKERTVLILIGAGWAMLISIIASLARPAQQPFRRQIALIWRAIGNLSAAVSSGWEMGQRSKIRDIYLMEKEVRTAIDSSFQFYKAMAHQVNEKDTEQYQLVQFRKASSMVATLIVAMSEDMDSLKIKELDNSLLLKLSTLFGALSQAIDRMSLFVITLKPEEEVLIKSNINRTKKLLALVNQYPRHKDEEQARTIAHITALAERTVKLVESAMRKLEQMGKDLPVFRSYTMMKTLLILNPKEFFNNLQIVSSLNAFTTRFALRTAVAAAVGLFIYKWFNIDHGYWMPFSVMIVMQPYFSATIKKAMDRVLGTLLGGITGSLLLLLPSSLHINEAILFITFVLMIYYFRKRYAVAAFVITLNLVLLFNIEGGLPPMIIVTRALCTIAGAALAVIAGFALLPTWDKKWLPVHFADAVCFNYNYFIDTFFSAKPINNWTKSKRISESKNNNVFDSFNRYIHEPLGDKRSTLYYSLITYNVRITRDLNNIHIEQDERTGGTVTATAAQQIKINECLDWFNKNIQLLKNVDPNLQGIAVENKPGYLSPFILNENQRLYVEKLLIELKTMHEDIEKLVDKEHIE